MEHASSHNSDFELLGRYLAGECDATERQRVQDWLEAAPENQAELDAL